MNIQSNTAEIIENENTNKDPVSEKILSENKDKLKPPKNQIIAQYYEAILDPKRLSLEEWLGIQESIKEIERLAPHIELIVRLRKEKNA